MTHDEAPKDVVETEKTIDPGEFEGRSATASGAANSSEQSTVSDRELPIPDYDELSVRGAKPRLDALSPDELRRLRAYEAEHKQRKTLIHEIDRRLR